MIITDTLADFLDDWKRHLRAAGKSDRTVSIYAGAALELIAFLGSNGYPTTPGAITRKHLERFFGWLAERPNKNNPSKTFPRHTSISSTAHCSSCSAGCTR